MELQCRLAAGVRLLQNQNGTRRKVMPLSFVQECNRVKSAPSEDDAVFRQVTVGVSEGLASFVCEDVEKFFRPLWQSVSLRRRPIEWIPAGEVFERHVPRRIEFLFEKFLCARL